jgi:hypothetical protein
MQHFVDILQGYIINQIHEVSWKEFEDDLEKVRKRSIISSLSEIVLEFPIQYPIGLQDDLLLR